VPNVADTTPPAVPPIVAPGKYPREKKVFTLDDQVNVTPLSTNVIPIGPVPIPGPANVWLGGVLKSNVTVMIILLSSDNWR
jgi:hypothetical protein